MTAYPPIEDLVPHGYPIRALDDLIEWEPGRAVCRLQLKPGAAFVRDGRVASVVALEYMAQAVAACSGYEAYLGGGRVRVGMIVGVRRMDLIQPHISVGSLVKLVVERVRGNEEVSTFKGMTYADEQLVAEAHLTLVHPEAIPVATA